MLNQRPRVTQTKLMGGRPVKLRYIASGDTFVPLTIEHGPHYQRVEVIANPEKVMLKTTPNKSLTQQIQEDSMSNVSPISAQDRINSAFSRMNIGGSSARNIIMRGQRGSGIKYL